MATNQKNVSLRSQFLTRIFLILLLIVVLSGIVQLIAIKQQISKDIDKQSNLISSSVEQGIEETNLASTLIEQQIDLKLVSNSRHIGDLLKGKTADQITNQELIQIRDRLNLAGITIIVKKQNDIIGLKGTDPKEIGFSFKTFGGPAYDNFLKLFQYELPKDGFLTTRTNEFQILPIVQSGSHTNTPTFFKYAYYHPAGVNYIIDPYLQANEVYSFTNKVGPNSMISKILGNNPYVNEIAVLDPRVYKDPTLEKKLYPPLKKVVYGTYTYNSNKDTETLIQMAEVRKQIAYVESNDGFKLYKCFIPLRDGKVIYIGLDYGKMSDPLYRHSAILIVSGLLSLLALFFITASFFNRIYENIQRIKTQMKLLEAGDFTAKSKVYDKSELGRLSNSANRMVDTLHQLLRDTSESAKKTQRLSVLLEADANQSVEKMFAISMETTIQSREQLDEIMDFLHTLEMRLDSRSENDKKDILEKIQAMRKIAQDRTSVTTDMTITLSDLLKSLYGQSSELSDISNTLLQHIAKFKLS